MQPSTKEITSHFVGLLDTYKILHWRMNLGAVRIKGGIRVKNSLAGFPDYAGCTKRGQLWVAEIKGPGDKLSDLQKGWLTKLSQNNALNAVLTNYDETLHFISHLLQN